MSQPARRRPLFGRIANDNETLPTLALIPGDYQKPRRYSLRLSTFVVALTALAGWAFMAAAVCELGKLCGWWA